MKEKRWMYLFLFLLAFFLVFIFIVLSPFIFLYFENLDSSESVYSPDLNQTTLTIHDLKIMNILNQTRQTYRIYSHKSNPVLADSRLNKEIVYIEVYNLEEDHVNFLIQDKITKRMKVGDYQIFEGYLINVVGIYRNYAEIKLKKIPEKQSSCSYLFHELDTKKLFLNQKQYLMSILDITEDKIDFEIDNKSYSLKEGGIFSVNNNTVFKLEKIHYNFLESEISAVELIFYSKDMEILFEGKKRTLYFENYSLDTSIYSINESSLRLKIGNKVTPLMSENSVYFLDNRTTIAVRKIYYRENLLNCAFLRFEKIPKSDLNYTGMKLPEFNFSVNINNQGNYFGNTQSQKQDEFIVVRWVKNLFEFVSSKF